ncbi:MAG: DedA family protein [Lachnospiraceae bacterium]|nr:DedA family protein [Lachnospiraceae bacterium]
MENLISFISQYGIYAMIIIVFLEYACFPVSSEIVLPLSGAAAAAAGMSYFPVTLVCSIAGLAGTYLIYAVSYHAGNKLSNKSKSGNLDSGKLAWCNRIIEKRGKYAVCISRVIPLFRTYIAFAAGLSHMSRRDYLAWSFLGIVVWNSVLIACGYVLGNNWSKVSAYYSHYKHIILVIFAVILTTVIFRKLLKTTKKV